MELIGSGNHLELGLQVREYHLQGVLGEGGFGIVYRAYDAGLDRTVAIKEYMPSALASRGGSHQIRVHSEHREAFDAGLRSFINEARLLAKFAHPALVHVYRFFEENGTAYMVMRHYEGQTFRAFLAEQQHHIDQRWLTAMLGPILDGLEMLHAADCFHRDIAPDNVFLQASGIPVLLDFGAARRIIGDLTQALTMVLKPGYAPIEQYADDGAMPQGAWTDIYQLGAMLYRAITGKVPATSVARMINDPIRMLTPTQYPQYSAQFLRGVHQALSVRPEDRPQSIAELKSSLGVEGFTGSALSAWATSDAVPLDLFVGREEAREPRAEPRSEGQAPVATPDAELSKITTVRLADSLINSPENVSALASGSPANKVSDDLMDFMARRQATPPASTTTLPKGQAPSRAAPSEALAPTESPVFLPKDAPLDAAASKGLWQPPAAQIVYAPNPLPVARAANNSLHWKLAASMTAAVLMLAGIWLLAKGKPEAEKPLSSAAQQQSWEAAKKAGSVASLQAYLAVYPAGEHAHQARAMLDKLNPVAVPAVKDKPTSPPEVQNSETSAAAPAAQQTTNPPAPPQSQPQPQPREPEPEPEQQQAIPDNNRPKPTPASPGANTRVAAQTNSSAPPLVIRPRPDPSKTEAPTASSTENKPPAPVEVGTVALKVTPWGQVRVNRSPVGSTPPLTQLNLPEGQHQIEISNQNGSTVTKLVQVTKGEVVVLSHKFD
jgi:non-specific serine/threonine protein kinase